MASIQGNEQLTLAYCKTCRRTLTISIKWAEFALNSPSGICKHTYVHEGPNGEPSHALVLNLDQNNDVRRAEVTDMCIESTKCPADFKVSSFCQMCQQKVEIPVSIRKFAESIDQRGFYTQSFIHGHTPHSLVVLLDKNRNVRRAEITNLNIESSIMADLRLGKAEKLDFVLLESRNVPKFSELFESLHIFDLRLKTVIGFFTGQSLTSIADITSIIEEIISSEHRSASISLLKDQQDLFLFMSEEEEIFLFGVNVKRPIHPWLLLLSNILLTEKEPPNTLGLEVFFKLIKANHKIIDESALRDILFSPFYSIRLMIKYEKIIELMFQRIVENFPNTSELFYPCALGKKTILEVINTERGIEHFNEFVNLISFIERRNLF
ncbi:MAG: hypothetical protein ACFFC7_32615 [Candidatus Hermodarchaeota archaeon]